MLPEILINGKVVTHGTAVPATETIVRGNAFLTLTVSATFGTVAGTNGLTATVSTSPDNTNFTAIGTIVIPGVASSTKTGVMQISLLNGDALKPVAGEISYVKVSLDNADATNTVDASVVAEQRRYQ